MQSRTDPNRARQGHIKQIACRGHDARVNITLERTARMMPYHITRGQVAEEVDAALGRPIMIRHAEHFLCSYDEWRRWREQPPRSKFTKCDAASGR